MQLYGPLDNYLATLRNRAGLSQQELSTLLGFGGHQAVGHYERGERMPEELERVIALEFILDEPIQAIFAGVAERVRAQIAWRAKALLEATSDKPTGGKAQKFETLARLAHIDEEDSIPSWMDAG